MQSEKEWISCLSELQRETCAWWAGEARLPDVMKYMCLNAFDLHVCAFGPEFYRLQYQGRLGFELKLCAHKVQAYTRCMTKNINQAKKYQLVVKHQHRAEDSTLEHPGFWRFYEHQNGWTIRDNIMSKIWWNCQVLQSWKHLTLRCQIE